MMTLPHPPKRLPKKYRDFRRSWAKYCTYCGVRLCQDHRLTDGSQCGDEAPQPIDEPVLTSSGWVKMGEIQPGDSVIGVDGKPVKVVSVYDRGWDDVYEVAFSDGASTRATGDHLWDVERWTSRKGKAAKLSKTVSTLELRNRKWGFRDTDSIPLPAPIRFPEKQYVIPPYTMGAMLGDGTLRKSSPAIKVSDLEILKAIEGEGVSLSWSRPETTDTGTLMYRVSLSDYARTGKKPINPYKVEFMKLGLWGEGSHTKFIPSVYQFGSVDQRKALLAGLMDTDGTLSLRGGKSMQRLVSSSLRLVEGVVDLVRGLGGTATLQQRGEYFYTDIRLPFNPFRLGRKVKVWTEPHHLNRQVVSVEEVGKAEVRCLRVDDPRHLYVTNDYIVTHNTWDHVVPNQTGKGILGRHKVVACYDCNQDRGNKTIPGWFSSIKQRFSQGSIKEHYIEKAARVVGRI